MNVWGGELGKIWGGRQEHRDTNQPLGGTAPTGGGPRFLPPIVVGAHFFSAGSFHHPVLLLPPSSGSRWGHLPVSYLPTPPVTP